MKKEINQAEDRLLNQTSLDDLIKMKMEQELKTEFEKSKEKHMPKVITDISEVPTDLIFSKKAVYKIFNRTNKTETYLNGVQAEAMLGMQISLREKIKTGQMDAFSTENAYVKFEKIEI